MDRKDRNTLEATLAVLGFAQMMRSGGKQEWVKWVKGDGAQYVLVRIFLRKKLYRATLQFNGFIAGEYRTAGPTTFYDLPAVKANLFALLEDLNNDKRNENNRNHAST